MKRSVSFIERDLKLLISAVLTLGFTQTNQTDDELIFEPCPAGTFSNSTSEGADGCTSCPPGGFYSDDVGHVSTSCKRCPNGSFVAYGKAPGKQLQDCKTCPLGTESDFFAGYRACMCLEGHYRTHMFKRCHKCEQGLQCQNDYAVLKSGYWWRWRNKTHKDRYRVFIANLLVFSPALGANDVQYPYSFPMPYKCPEETACKGGMDSTCTNGYKGPLCSVCNTGYYKQFHQCRKCPSQMLLGGQLLVIVVVISTIIVVCVWSNKRNGKNDEKKASLAVSFLSKIKIAIGFYQVTYGLLEAFSFIKWPDSLRAIAKHSQVIQLNILEMAPIHCLFPELNMDALGHLLLIMAANFALILLGGVTYGVRKLIISRNDKIERVQKSLEVSRTKELTYRNLFFFLYVTYLSTCSKTATVLPLSCWDLCRDKEEESCLKYLKADKSIRCYGPGYNKLVIVAYISTAYIIALPTATFIILWRQRRMIRAKEYNDTAKDSVPGTELIKGLHFLYEGYKPRSWFWELIEMSRKVVVTSGLILVGQESRSYIGLAWTVAGMYGILFAWYRPMQDAFENRLMTTSIAVTIFNLGVGAASKIPSENLPASADFHMDNAMFTTLVLGANSLVIGLLAFQYVLHVYEFIKEWRKSPQWSFSCCLAMALPLVSLPGEISSMVGKNIGNTQLKAGTIETTTIADALQDSGATDVSLEEVLESDNNPPGTNADNITDPRPNNGRSKTLSDGFTVQHSAPITGSFCERGNKVPMKEWHVHRPDTAYKCKTSHQGTQTKLSMVLPSGYCCSAL